MAIPILHFPPFTHYAIQTKKAILKINDKKLA